MKIALLSDLHGFLPQIDTKDIDCVLIAGDICPDFANFYKQGTWVRMGLNPWLDQFKEVKFIGGNHDFYFDMEGCDHPHYLNNSHATIGDGLLVYGFQYTICPRWAFHKSDEEIKNLLTNHPKPDIMLCHNPPFGICDRVQPSFSHVGSTSIRSYLEEVQPKVCVFGHIHEGYGYYKLGDTHCINCAFVDRDRKRRMQYLTLDTKDMSIEIVPCKEWKYD